MGIPDHRNWYQQPEAPKQTGSRRNQVLARQGISEVGGRGASDKKSLPPAAAVKKQPNWAVFLGGGSDTRSRSELPGRNQTIESNETKTRDRQRDADSIMNKSIPGPSEGSRSPERS